MKLVEQILQALLLAKCICVAKDQTV